MVVALETKVLKDKNEIDIFLKRKRGLIEEAIGFPIGTQERKAKKVVNFSDGIEVAFLKPGKEASRQNPNTNDMYPIVSFGGKEMTEKYSFQDMWTYMFKTYLVNKEVFKQTSVLLYRLCFFRDHTEEKGKFRYRPSVAINKVISDLEKIRKEGFKKQFNDERSPTLKQFLYFVDLLGWNEDVKYYTKKPELFSASYSKSTTGRTNTILSIINAPIMISKFYEDIVSKTQTGGAIDVDLITSVIQKFTRTRGICAPTKGELSLELAPYLREE
ncbi:MAG: hypothetical protein FWD89_01590 [Firmicutes bacterium]|nr:hypothetical protein [Bacillota bacterium]